MSYLAFNELVRTYLVQALHIFLLVLDGQDGLLLRVF
jgi:hypothetical protein